jgi:hypothetical protein
LAQPDFARSCQIEKRRDGAETYTSAKPAEPGAFTEAAAGEDFFCVASNTCVKIFSGYEDQCEAAR